MDITGLLVEIGRPLAFYPCLRNITKSTVSTIFLCQFIYWTDKQEDPNGWIFKTSQEIEEETGLTYDEQVTARKTLVKLGFIEEFYKRIDHQMFYRIKAELIISTVLKKRSE